MDDATEAFTWEATPNIVWMLDSSHDLFLPDKFQSHPLTQYGRIVVLLEKITWSQSIALWSCAHYKRFIRWFLVSNAFDKGRLYFVSASFERRRTVLSFSAVISRLVTNICCSSSETICWSRFGVVARAGPVRSESLKFFDCFHCLSQYCTVDVLHLTAFATDLCVTELWTQWMLR